MDRVLSRPPADVRRALICYRTARGAEWLRRGSQGGAALSVRDFTRRRGRPLRWRKGWYRCPTCARWSPDGQHRYARYFIGAQLGIDRHVGPCRGCRVECSPGRNAKRGTVVCQDRHPCARAADIDCALRAGPGGHPLPDTDRRNGGCQSTDVSNPFLGFCFGGCNGLRWKAAAPLLPDAPTGESAAPFG
jgi:hypothetical protein